MAEARLILTHTDTGVGFHDQAVPEDLRFALYRCCMDNDLWAFRGARYTVTAVQWQVPAREIRCAVRFHSYETAALPPTLVP